MKKLLVVVFFLFIVAIAGFFIFLLTLDVNQYKPLLTGRIEDAIQKNVKIGNISLIFCLGWP